MNIIQFKTSLILKTIILHFSCVFTIFASESPIGAVANLNSQKEEILASNKSDIRILAELMELYSGKRVMISDQIKNVNLNLEIKSKIKRLKTTNEENFIHELKRLSAVNNLVFKDKDKVKVLQELFPIPKDRNSSTAKATEMFYDEETLPEDPHRVIMYHMKLSHVSADDARSVLESRIKIRREYQAINVVCGTNDQLLIFDTVEAVRSFIIEKSKFDRPKNNK